MAYLGKYIRQILSKKERVILPGFGSLLLSESKGAPSGSGRMDPPGMVITFDAEHPRDDGRLAAAYAEGEQLDPGEATQQVLELVDAIKFKLDKGEKFSLELVGVFSRDNDNRIHFQKDPNWIIDPDLFGLPPLDLLVLEEEPAVAATPEAVPSPDKVSSPDKKPSPIQKEPVPMEKKREVKRTPVNKWKIIWIVVGSLIAVLVLILLIPVNDSEYGIGFTKEGIVLKENRAGKQEPGQEKPVIDESEKEPVEQVEPEVEQTAPVADNNFYIIAGSFQALANATELMEDLKAKGFPAEIIFTDSRMYRVSVQAYPDKESAMDALPGIMTRSGLSSCWVMAR